MLTGMTRDGTFLIEDGRITRPLRDVRFTDSITRASSARTEDLTAGAAARAARPSSTGAASRTGVVVPGAAGGGFRVTGSTRAPEPALRIFSRMIVLTPNAIAKPIVQRSRLRSTSEPPPNGPAPVPTPKAPERPESFPECRSTRKISITEMKTWTTERIEFHAAREG